MNGNPKTGPRGASSEAEIRKKILNAKLEAFHRGLYDSLESLDPERPLPATGYLTADAPQSLPRQITYVSRDPGPPERFYRSFLLAEERVPGKQADSKLRRPDLFTLKYELSAQELALLRDAPGADGSTRLRPTPWSTVRAQLGDAIPTAHIDARSVDFNQPLGPRAAGNHMRKHADTARAAYEEIIGRHKIALAEGGRVNFIVKEWYHLNPSWWDAHAKALGSDQRGLKFVESHTAVFSMDRQGGRMRVAAPALESVAYEGRAAAEKEWRTRDVQRLGPAAGAGPDGLRARLGSFAKIASELREAFGRLSRRG